MIEQEDNRNFRERKTAHGIDDCFVPCAFQHFHTVNPFTIHFFIFILSFSLFCDLLFIFSYEYIWQSRAMCYRQTFLFITSLPMTLPCLPLYWRHNYIAGTLACCVYYCVYLSAEMALCLLSLEHYWSNNKCFCFPSLYTIINTM